MKKLIVATSAFIALAGLETTIQAQTLVSKWQKTTATSTAGLNNDSNTRAIALNPKTGHLYLADKIAANSVFILDGLTGANFQVSAANAVLVTGTLTDGPENAIGVSDDGAIFVAAIAGGSARTTVQLWRWPNENDGLVTGTGGGLGHAPTAVISGGVTGLPSFRYGDSIGVSGSGINTRILLGTVGGVVALISATDTNADGTGKSFVVKQIDCTAITGFVGVSAGKFGLSYVGTVSANTDAFYCHSAAGNAYYVTYNSSDKTTAVTGSAGAAFTIGNTSGGGQNYDPLTGYIIYRTRNTGAATTVTDYLYGTTGTGHTLAAPGASLNTATSTSINADSGVGFTCAVWGSGRAYCLDPNSHLTCYAVAPVLVTAPSNATKNPGQTAVFSGVVGGSVGGYSWKHGATPLSDGGNISGSTTATLTVTGVSQSDAGTYTLTAAADSVVGSPGHDVTTSGTLTVNKLSQTISGFGAISDKLSTNAPFNLSATASSGLTVVYTVISGPATVSGNTVTLTGAAGTVTISATQPGDATYNAAPAVPNQSFNVTIANHAPVAHADSISRPDLQGTKVSAATLLSNDTDADSDTLSLTAVSASSTQGGTVSLSSGYVFYTPPGGNPSSDTFTYTVSDGKGGTDTGTVTVTIAPADNSQPHNFQLTTLGDGTAQLDFAGIPNVTYLIQATPSLGSPSWETIATNTAGTNGLFEYIDLDATNHVSRFYRTATP